MHELGDGMHAEFLHQPPAMGFDGLDGNMKAFGDVFIFAAFGDELNNFAFARGEMTKRRECLALRMGGIAAERAREIEERLPEAIKSLRSR